MIPLVINFRDIHAKHLLLNYISGCRNGLGSVVAHWAAGKQVERSILHQDHYTKFISLNKVTPGPGTYSRPKTIHVSAFEYTVRYFGRSDNR